MASFADNLHDPVLYAVPVFAAFMAVELFSLRYLDEAEAGAGAYEVRDTRTNLLMGLGYLDRNYGGVLIVWDRLFGAYAQETHRPRYGLTTNIDSFNPFRLQYHEYATMIHDVRRAHDWRARIGYVLGPPGWRPSAVHQPVEGLDVAATADQ